MLQIDIPAFGKVEALHLVSDFTGTLSVDGILLPGVSALLEDVAHVVKVHVLTADTFHKANEALRDVPCEVTILSSDQLDRQKEQYVQKLGAEQVVAMGNGANDHLMLKAARIGIAVIEGEGCAVSALMHADIVVRSVSEALDLLLHPKRCMATLRR